MQQYIDPSYKPHIQLEEQATEYLLNRDFLVFTGGTYHQSMPDKIVKILQNRYSLTALYLRSRADRIAIHKIKQIEFEFECKTHSNSEFEDIVLEALPIVHYILKSRLGVRCLYIYHNPFIEQHCGFWINNIPTIWKIYIPSRWTGERRTDFNKIFNEFFPNIYIKESKTAGSNDQFIIIQKNVARQLPTWQSLIDNTIEKNELINKDCFLSHHKIQNKQLLLF